MNSVIGCSQLYMYNDGNIFEFCFILNEISLHRIYINDFDKTFYCPFSYPAAAESLHKTQSAAWVVLRKWKWKKRNTETKNKTVYMLNTLSATDYFLNSHFIDYSLEKKKLVGSLAAGKPYWQLIFEMNKKK